MYILYREEDDWLVHLNNLDVCSKYVYFRADLNICSVYTSQTFFDVSESRVQFVLMQLKMSFSFCLQGCVKDIAPLTVIRIKHHRELNIKKDYLKWFSDKILNEILNCSLELWADTLFICCSLLFLLSECWCNNRCSAANQKKYI